MEHLFVARNLTWHYCYYRIKMISSNNSTKYSQTIVLENLQSPVSIGTVINPIHNSLTVSLAVFSSSSVSLELIDQNGVIVHKQQFTITNGNNLLTLANTRLLASSVYTLRITVGNNIFIKRAVKQ